MNSPPAGTRERMNLSSEAQWESDIRILGNGINTSKTHGIQPNL
jgi:hypothetical protein